MVARCTSTYGSSVYERHAGVFVIYVLRSVQLCANVSAVRQKANTHQL